IILTRTFGQDVIERNLSRRRSQHFGTAVGFLGRVAVVVPAPYPRAAADYVDQVTCALAGFGRSTLHCRLGSDKVQLGKLGNIERPGAARIGLSQAIAVVGAVRAQLPQSRIDTAADALRRDHIVGPAGEYPRPDTALVGFIVIVDRHLWLLIQESED